MRESRTLAREGVSEREHGEERIDSRVKESRFGEVRASKRASLGEKEEKSMGS